MLTTRSYIYDYVTEDARFFHAFDQANFISNAKVALGGALSNTTFSIQGNHYSHILEKTISHINDIELDTYAVSEFVSKILNSGRVDAAKLMMKDISNTESIITRPQYLTESILYYKEIIDGIVSGKIDSSKIRKHCEQISQYIIVLKKKLVHSDIDVIVNSKDLLKYNNFEKVEVTTKYLEDVVIPFIRDIFKKKKELHLELSAINTTINTSVADLRRTLEEITSDLSKYSEEQKKMIMRLTFNHVRSIMEGMSFITYAILRKAHQFEEAVVECQNMYNALTLVFNDAMPVVETGVFDKKIITATDTKNMVEKLVEGSNDVFAELSHNIIEYHKGYISTHLSDLSDVAATDTDGIVTNLLSDKEFDRTVYIDIVKSYIAIGDGLNTLAKNCDDYLAIFDELLAKAGFIISLEDRFHNEIEALDDLSKYAITELEVGNSGEKTNVYYTILAEINAYPEITKQIAEACNVIQTKAEYVEELFNAKKNGELAYSETMNELKIFLDSFKDQFEAFNSEVVKGLYLRLKTLAAKADDCTDNVYSTPESDIYNDDDFFSEAVIANLEEMDAMNDIVMEALLKEYYSEREFKERGVRLVYEAEGENNTKVTVTDNSGVSSGTPQKADGSTLGGKIQNFFAGIIEWFKKMIEKFNEVTGRQKEKNLKWLAANKEGLLNRSYSNVEIRILPYDKFDSNKATKDITTMTNNVRAMNLTNLKNLTSYENLRNRLINFGPRFIDDDEKVAITNYYKVGNNPLQTVPYANSAIKTLVADVMIPYCESFYDAYSQAITNQLTDLSKALEDVAKTYVAEAVEEVSSVSVFTEAKKNDNQQANQQNTTNQNNANTEEKSNITTKATWVKQCCVNFSGSIMNAIRDRNNDFFKALYALAPKNKPVAQTTTPDTNTEAQPEANKK